VSAALGSRRRPLECVAFVSVLRFLRAVERTTAAISAWTDLGPDKWQREQEAIVRAMLLRIREDL